MSATTESLSTMQSQNTSRGGNRSIWPAYCFQQFQSQGVDQETIFYVLTTIVVGLGMIGIGATVHYKVLWKYIKQPKAYLFGVIGQLVIMPLLAWAFTRMFQMPLGEALGVFIQGCSPGGNISNLVVYWVGGIVDLSVAMTVTTTLLALGTMPLWLLVYSKGENLPSESEVPYSSLGISLGVMVATVFFGMLIRAKASKKRAERISMVLIILASIGILVIAVVRGVLSKVPWTVSWRQGVVSCLMPLVAYLIGYLITVVPGVQLKGRSRRTVSVEVALQNAQIAAAVIQLSYGRNICLLVQMILFPLLYYVFQIGYSIVFVLGYIVAKNRGWIALEDNSNVPSENQEPSSSCDKANEEKKNESKLSEEPTHRRSKDDKLNPTFENDDVHQDKQKQENLV